MAAAQQYEFYLELGADGGSAVLRANLQRVLLVAALDAFKQVVDKVQAVGGGGGWGDTESVEQSMLGRRCFLQTKLIVGRYNCRHRSSDLTSGVGWKINLNKDI